MIGILNKHDKEITKLLKVCHEDSGLRNYIILQLAESNPIVVNATVQGFINLPKSGESLIGYNNFIPTLVQIELTWFGKLFKNWFYKKISGYGIQVVWK